jgi:predicted Rossmann fold flavoprotein
VAPGGLPKRSQYDFLDALQLDIVPPLPSIFTFHTGNAALHALSGLALPEVSLRAEGQKQSFSGPMLVTHWGLSGPAVLRCSAWLARHLAQLDYRFPLYARLIPFSEAEFRAMLEQWMREHPKKRLYNQTPPGMPARFWSYLLSELGIPEALCVAELGKKDKNRIAETVLNHRFEVRGKSPFKEEFVTAGGVALEEINAARMESKKHPASRAALIFRQPGPQDTLQEHLQLIVVVRQAWFLSGTEGHHDKFPPETNLILSNVEGHAQ